MSQDRGPRRTWQRARWRSPVTLPRALAACEHNIVLSLSKRFTGYVVVVFHQAIAGTLSKDTIP